LKKSIVSIVKSPKNPKDEDIRLAVRKAVDLIGGMKKFVKPGSKVLVKPNMCSIALPDEPRPTTEPHVTAAVIELAFEAGAEDVYVAEGAGIGCDTDKVYDTTGTRKLAEAAGGRVIDVKDGEFVEVENPKGMKMKRFEVAEIAWKCDVRINVPMLKIELPTTISVALKNWASVLSDKSKLELLHHRGAFWTYSDLLGVVKQDLVVVDGIIPYVRYPGETKEIDVIMAGNDPVAIDAVSAKILGFDPMEIHQTRIAAERGLGNANLDQIEIRGNPLDSVTTRLYIPPAYVSELVLDSRFKDIGFVDGLPCSGCVQAVLFTWEMNFEKPWGKPELLKYIKDLTIVLGPQAEVPQDAKNVLIVGSCAKHLKDRGEFAYGCVPYSADIFKAIKRIYGLK